MKRAVSISIGSSLAGVIEDLYATGHSSVLDKLRHELPKGVLELSQVPGLTLKRIESLNETLGIDNIADLKSALDDQATRLGQVFQARLDGLRWEIEASINRLHRFSPAYLIRNNRQSLDELVRRGAKAIEHDLSLRQARLAFDSARSYMIAWGWSYAAVFGTGILMIVIWLLWAMF